MEDYCDRGNCHSRDNLSGLKYSGYNQISPEQRSCYSREGYYSVRPTTSQNDLRSTMGSFVYNTPQKSEKSSGFFKDTRINSCSYVKNVKRPDSTYVAVPFYEKPQKTYADSMARSTYSEGFSNYSYKSKSIPYAGMGMNKPLERYNPIAHRSRMNTANEFYYPRNKITLVSIGDRTSYNGDKNNVWKTTNMVEYSANKHSSKYSSHQGIKAFRSRWDTHLKRKN